MKITRKINGKTVEIELTPFETLNAYYEQQRQFDELDVIDQLTQYGEQRPVWKNPEGKEVEVTFGQIKRIAMRFRKALSNYSDLGDFRHDCVLELTAEIMREDGIK